MSSESNHELLSAYLDGELTADERRHVEQLLAESAEYRQVYEELCALRASLSSLPRHKLTEDLGPRVLRIAQESTSGDGKEPAARRQDESIESAAGNLDAAGRASTAERTSRRWRAIVYPVLAVAAALAMMLNSEKQKDKHDRHDQQIARAPMRQDPPAAMSAWSGSGDEEASIARDEDFDKADLPALPRSVAENASDSVQSEALRAAAPLPAGDQKLPSGASGPRSSKGRAGGKMPAAGGAKSDLGRPNLRAALQASETALIVACKLAPVAVQDKAFESLLARHHLAPQAAPADLAKAISAQASKPSGYLDDARLETNVDQGKKSSEDDLKPAQANAWTKDVVLELDARQLEAVLADLQSHPDQFLSVETLGQPAGDGPLILGRSSAAESKNLAQQLFKLEPTDEFDQKDAEAKRKSNQPVAADRADSAEADDSEAAGGRSPGRLRILFRLSAAPNN